MVARLLQALAEGTWVLTANQRLERFLEQRYAEWQRAQGRGAWPTPPLLGWEAWLKRLWAESRPRLPEGSPEPELLLSDSQSAALWRQVLEEPAALSPEAAAAQAQEAWRLLHLWRLPPLATHPDPGPEALRFSAWAERYGRRCTQRGWLDAALLPAQLADWARRDLLRLPGPAPLRIILAGYDELHPAQQQLLDALHAVGVQWSRAAEPAAPGSAAVAAFADGEAELEGAARWARAELERDPALQVGIVIPDLERRRPAAERWLREALAAPDLLPGAAGRAGPFNISLGDPLAQVPVLRGALLLLELSGRRVTLERISAVLHSPFVGEAEEERDRRSLLEVRLRDLGGMEWPPEALLRQARPQDAAPWHCPHLARRLEQALAAAAGWPRTQGLAGWAGGLHRWLRLLGWPGQRPRSSAEHQALQRWEQLLDGLAALDVVLPPQTWQQALGHLHRLAGESLFQPQGTPAPVQVLGLLEAGGLAFDRLWVAGMDHEAWPRPARPHPLLPLDWQRQHNLPRSSAARELDYARQVFSRLRAAAPRVVFSHALLEGERRLGPSPLLAGLPPWPGAPDAPPRYTVLMQRSGRLEAWSDERAPALAAAGEVPGGTGVFKDMAACPFRAFALHRLRAEPWDSPQPGLDPAQRGRLVHRVMELLWSDLRDQAALLALDETARAQSVQRAVAATLAEAQRRPPFLITPALAGLEQARLTALALEFLALEALRTPFAVQAREEPRTATIGGLTVRTRVDRVDRLAGGGLLIVDYKTGAAALGAWFSDRPDEPQVPLYAVTVPEPVAGVVIAQVRKGQPRYVGLAEDSTAVPGVQPFAEFRDRSSGEAFAGRTEVLARWRAALAGLAQQFAAGAADVAPKHGAQTCRLCPLPGLCRIGDSRAGYWLGAAEAAGADAGDSAEQDRALRGVRGGSQEAGP